MYGTKIASIRLARGYTQEYMAQKLGMAQNVYSKIEKNEKNKLDDELLEKIAETLGVTVDDIKSPTPIIMSFHNNGSQYNNTPFGTTYNQIQESIIEELRNQLKVKDDLIARQLELIARLSSK